MKKLLNAKIIIPILALITLGIIASMMTNKETMPAWGGNLTTVSGKTITESEVRGKVLMVNFWATSCSSCVAEMPHLKKIYQDYQSKGFELIALAMPYDKTSLVKNFQKNQDIPFPMVHDDKGVLIPRFGRVVVTPTTMLYDKNGVKQYAWIGPMADKKLRTTLDNLLAN